VIEDSTDFGKVYNLLFNDEMVSWLGSLDLQSALTQSWYDYTLFEIRTTDFGIVFTTQGEIFEIDNNQINYTDFEKALGNTLSPTATTDPNDCWATAMSQYDMNICAGKDYKDIKEVMQKLLNEFIHLLSDDSYQALLATQTEWETTAGDLCKWEASFNEGGSIQGMVETDCMTYEYKQRINDLRMDLCADYGVSGECEASLRYKQDD
jgi:uncharacterized protein YecT (DUF1311 family)